MGIGNMTMQAAGQTSGKTGGGQAPVTTATSVPTAPAPVSSNQQALMQDQQAQLAKMVAGGNAYMATLPAASKPVNTPLQSSARSSLGTLPTLSQQPRFGEANRYASSVGMRQPWDQASLMPTTMGKGIGKGGGSGAMPSTGKGGRAPALAAASNSPYSRVQEGMQTAQTASQAKQTTTDNTTTTGKNSQQERNVGLMDAADRGW